MSRLLVFVFILYISLISCSQKKQYGFVEYNDQYKIEKEAQVKIESEKITPPVEIKKFENIKKSENKIGIILINHKKRTDINEAIIESAALAFKDFKLENGLEFIFLDQEDIKNKKNKNYDHFSLLYFPFLKFDNKILNFAKQINSDLKIFTDDKFCEKEEKGQLCVPFFKGGKIYSYFDFLELKNKSHVSFLIPNNQKGYVVTKEIEDNKKDKNIHIRNIEFFEESNAQSILKCVTNIKNSFYKKIYVNRKSDKIVIVDSKNRNKYKNDENLVLETFPLESIYIQSTEEDLTLILDALNTKGLIEKNIIFAMETDSKTNINRVSNNFYLKDFIFVGFNYESRNLLDENIKQNFGSDLKFNNLSYFNYDILSMSLIWMKENESRLDKLSFEEFYRINKFHGITGIVTFENKSIIKKYDLYRLDKNNDFFKYFEIN